MLLIVLIIFFLLPPAVYAGWEYTAPMPTAREGLAVAAVGGKIYAIGGKNHSGYNALDIVEIYNTSTHNWIPGPPLHHRRIYAAAAVYNGKIFVFGGRDGMWMVNQVEMLDPAFGYWVEVGDMCSREGLSATTMGDSIIVLGGKINQWSYSASADIYDPINMAWNGGLPNYPIPRAGHGGAAMGDSLFIIGGVSYWMMDDVSIFDGYAWQNGPNLPFPLGNTGAAVIGDCIYVVAGNTGWGGSTKKVLKRSFAVSGWMETDSLNTARDYHGVVAWEEKLYAIGGGYGNFDNRIYLASVEMLDLTNAVQPPAANNDNTYTLSISNYPNPFSRYTNIVINLGTPELTDQPVIIYDILGREIMRWNTPAWRNGNLCLNWDGADSFGHSLPSGVYFLQIKMNSGQLTGKISIVR